jgi:type I restriction enzyme S subunit
MKINRKLEETSQAIYKQWFVDFEFPDKNGKPYKSSGGEMVWNAVLEKEIPEGWDVQEVEKVIPVKDGTHDSPSEVPNGNPLVTSMHLKPYTVDIKNTYNISAEDFINIKQTK